MTEDAEGGARAAAACRVNLRRVLVGEVGNGGVEDGREGLQLVDKDEVAEGARREEESVALFQRHRAAELGFVVVVTCEEKKYFKWEVPGECFNSFMVYRNL
jgi:hypothetical protein